VSIEHDYFGVIADDGSGGLCWSDTVEFGDQSVDVSLSAQSASAVSEDALLRAAELLKAIEHFDARARDAMIAGLSQRESVTTSYIDSQVDDLGENLLDLLVHTSGDIAMDVLRSLQLVRLALYPEHTRIGEPFAVFDYSLSPDDSDYLLVVAFDDAGDVVAIDMES